jgi:hypothetical protein
VSAWENAKETMLFEVVGIVSTSISLVSAKNLCHYTEKIKTDRKSRGR